MRAVLKYTILTLLFCLLGSITSFAGEWIQNDVSWSYIKEDGSHSENEWLEIGNRYYYFNSDGYMLTNSITPDEHWIGNDGYWISDSGINQEAMAEKRLKGIAVHLWGNFMYA